MISKMIATDLHVDDDIRPLGLQNISPSFSWIPTASGRRRYQSAYRLLVASSAGTLSLDQGDFGTQVRWNQRTLTASCMQESPFKAKLVILAIGNIGLVGGFFVIAVLVGDHHPGGQPQKSIHPAHPLRIAGGQVIVHRDHVNPIAG